MREKHEKLIATVAKIVIFDAKILRIGQNHKNATPFSAIDIFLIFKIVFRIVIFRKILDGVTVQKSQKHHEKSISTTQLLKKNEFRVLNGFDHQHEVIRGRT